jgi:methionyl-tRNA formyltransferase
LPRIIRVLFLGTSEFAVPVLDALCASDLIEIEGVVTRPARPAGRGRSLRHPPVALRARAGELPLHQPEKLRKSFREEISGSSADVLVSAAYGAYLPGWLLESAPLGVVNIHPSLLPAWRGAAPVTRAILAGEKETGVTFMLTDSGWDTGPLLHSITMEIEPGDTTGTLERKLSRLAASAVVEVLTDYSSGELFPVPQEGEATYAEKVNPEETWLDWARPAEELERAVRAFQPAPGARTLYRGKTLKIHSASVSGVAPGPGRVYLTPDGGMVIGCGEGGSLEILTLQPESGRVMDATAFVRGYRPEEGEECRKA